MSDLSTPGADALLNGTAIPATLYAQAHIGDPGTNGTANVASSSARQAMTRDVAAAGAAGFREALSNNLLEWLNWPADETITHLTWWSASSGGTCWFVDNIADTPVLTGQTLSIDATATAIRFPIWT